MGAVKITLNSKLLMFSGLLVVITVIIVIFSFFSFNKLEERDQVRRIQSLLIQNNQLRDELSRKRDSLYSERYYEVIREMKANFSELDSIIVQLKDDNVEKVRTLLGRYEENFNTYKDLQLIRGLNEDSGLEGDFRDKVHNIESIVNRSGDKDIYLNMLQIRRREKDYILRMRKEYVDSVKKIISILERKTYESFIGKNKKDSILTLAVDYKTSFMKLVDTFEQIQNLENILANIEGELSKILDTMVDKNAHEAQRMLNLQFPVLAFLIILSIFLSVVISRSITKPVVHLQKATMDMSKGDYSVKVDVNTNDEIADLGRHFNEMAKNIKHSKETIEEQRNILKSQNDELQDLNATKDKFFSIIAHDLKNPINAFSGIATFINDRFDDLSREELKEFVTDIKNSSKHLYELLENLLTWSRAQRGKFQFHPTMMDLSQIINNNIYLNKINAENKNIGIITEIGPGTECFADPNMINTVVRNLLSNAIKFTPDSGKIFFKAAEDGKFLKVSIIDTGVGISPENIDKLFRIDVHHTTMGTSAEKGTGLGLILCKEFIKKHGGEIWVESEPGKGSEFLFTLPLTEEIFSGGNS
jgi:signal transduction histidine kinase